MMRRVFFSLFLLSVSLGIVEWSMLTQPETRSHSELICHLSNGTFVLFMVVWPWANVWPFARKVM
jgi:hypothetical protein